MAFPNGRNSGGRRQIRVPDPLPNPATSSLLDDDDRELGFGGGRLETPPTPMLVLRPGATASPSTPDTEANVAHQTAALFGTFVIELDNRRQTTFASSCLAVDDNNRAALGTSRPATDSVSSGGVERPDDTLSTVFANNRLLPMTAANETTAAVPDEMLTTEMRVGRQLAVIADDVNARYSNDFNKMVRQLRVDQNTAYDTFASIARQLFSDGVINWGRIIVLLCFGYRIIESAVRGCRSMCAKLFSFVIDFIIREKIAHWVAAQGGWIAAMRYIPESIGVRTIGAILGLAAVCVAAAIYLTKNH